ncbi:hypothetical protein MMC09_003035 [Bachmanniomyces sp. S44760]|nr:hypothetical protein [Bachmanniomyces sp. S44760]
MATTDLVASAIREEYNSKNPKQISCTLCQQRKVKCDKQEPCANCTKARVHCVYRAPAPPRRRKKRTEADLIARLKQMEDQLRTYGAKIEYADTETADGGFGDQEMEGLEQGSIPQIKGGQFTSPDLSPPMKEKEEETAVEGKPVETGRLVEEGSKSRFLENNTWISLSNEFQNPRDVLQGSSGDEDEKSDRSEEDERDEKDGQNGKDDTPRKRLTSIGNNLLFGSKPRNISLSSLHPSPVHIYFLWQTFLENINPLIKILHTPTMQKTILEATADIQKVGRANEALLFAIYALSVVSLKTEVCERTLGDSKRNLLAKFHYAAEQAFFAASLLRTSDMVVLQAFTLYLLSVRKVCDPHVYWTLNGIALRIGQRIGLHRDGAEMGISPFAVEMRRRLWWEILFCDVQAAEASGVGASILANFSNTKPPLNVNDSDLYPEMKEPPAEHDRPTDMIFMIFRCTVGQFIRNYASPSSGFNGSWHKLTSPEIPLADKDRAIDDLERKMDSMLLKHYDPSIPIHFMTSGMAKAVICKMRLMAHRPQQYSDKGALLTQSEKDLLFDNSIKIIEYSNLSYTSPATVGYTWHVDVHFQWYAFIYMLNELRYRTTGDMADRAWRQVCNAFDNRPEMLTETKKALHVAIGNLALKTWEARQAEYIRQMKGHRRMSPPPFVQTLYTQRVGSSSSSNSQTEADMTQRKADTVTRNNVPDTYMKEDRHFYYPQTTAAPPSETHWSTSNTDAAAAATAMKMGNRNNPQLESIIAHAPVSLPHGFLDPALSPVNWEQWDELLQNFEFVG